MKMFKPMPNKMEDDGFEAFLFNGKLNSKVNTDGINQTICVHCEHFSGFTTVGKPYCKAFPGGIPDKFWSGKVDHTTPYDGDNDVTFQPFTS